MARIWIKICGLTSELAVRTAISAGVDAVGFVFAPSKRQVTAEQAAQLAATVPAKVQRIAVMLHPTQTWVNEVLKIFKPDVLQTDWQDLAELTLPSELMVLPVMRAGQAMPGNMPIRFLFEGPVSGTGEKADWTQAASLTHGVELILAGGLNPANIAGAIRAVRPFGVDVSSGVEASPGVKDPLKMIEFVQAARAAL